MQRRPLMHRITAWMALVGYVLLASGLPLPVGTGAPVRDPAAVKRLAGKDRSRPFPCMDKPCGCATAEQCFTKCCCHTPAETLAWARANRVEPGVIAALERRAAAPAVEGSCCAASRPVHAKPSCCATTPPAGESACEAEEPGREPTEPVPVRTVVLRAMLACGGIVAQWLAIGVALPPTSPVMVVRSAARVERVLLPDDVCSGDRAAPDAPPPRVA